jgi:hypothetical protein
MFYESLSRDHEDGLATGQTLEDAREDAHIRGRSKRFMKYPDLLSIKTRKRIMDWPGNVKRTVGIEHRAWSPGLRIADFGFRI